MTSTLEVITPEQAAAYLEGQGPNRRQRETEIDRWARDMKRTGGWRINGETVKFYADGSMADGQHRMRACVRAGVPFTTWVIRGIDAADQRTVDIGGKRTLANILALSGIAHANTEAAAVGWYWRLRETPPGVVPTDSNAPTPDEMDLIRQTTAISASTERVVHLMLESAMKVGRAGVFAAMHCIFSSDGDKVVADEFFERVILGIDLDAASPIYVLRGRLGDAKNRFTTAEVAALTIKSFTAYRDGRHIANLRWRRNGPAAESFPSWK